MQFQYKKCLFRLVLGLLLLMRYPVSAQVNKIKKASEQNQSNHQNNNSSGQSDNNSSKPSNSNSGNQPINSSGNQPASSSGSVYIEPSTSNSGSENVSYDRYGGANIVDAAEGCASLLKIFGDCIELSCTMFINIGERIERDQNAIMLKKGSIRELNMLEIMPQAAFSNKNGVASFIPRIRGIRGLFSTDFRICQLADTRQDAEIYSSFDWNLLQYAFINTSYYHLRLGTGFMHERFGSVYFHEHFIGNDIKWSKRINSNIEYHLAYDYATDLIARSELNVRTNFEIIKKAPLHIHAMIGVVYQNYYESVEFWSAQTGFMLRLD